MIEIFVLLIRNKFIDIDEEYNDEIEQFISIFKFLARNNLNIKKSMDEILDSGHVKY